MNGVTEFCIYRELIAVLTSKRNYDALINIRRSCKDFINARPATPCP